MKKVIFETTFSKLKKAGACESGYKKLVQYLGGVTKYGANKPINLLTILESNGADDMLWALCTVDHPELEKIARLMACDFAETSLHLYESRCPDDQRPRNAIIAARQFANGETDEAARSAAWSAAESAARSAAESAARSAARSAAWSAAWSAARSAARSAAWSAARSAQAEIIKQYLM